MKTLGNALHLPYPSGVAQMAVTSPPYWGLRNYNVDGQFGLERVPDCLGWARGENCGACYVCRTVLWAREVWRVLRDDGVLFLNLGDSYASGEVGSHDSVQANDGREWSGTRKNKDRQRAKLETGLKPKDLVGIPWLVAFALRADGWYLRQDVIWAKPNPMPESVTDRCTKSHEYVFILSKQARYFWDAEAVKEESVDKESYDGIRRRGVPSMSLVDRKNYKFSGSLNEDGTRGGEGKTYPTRNPRSVWKITTQPYSGAHFATMPPALAEKCILAGSRVGDYVLDPFEGSGTTARMAAKHGRRSIGVELNPDYIALHSDRVTVQMAMMV